MRTGQYASAIVPLKRFSFKAVAALSIAAILCAAGCRRSAPATADSSPRYVPNPSVAPTGIPQAANAEAKVGLTATLARVLESAHRTGSLVEHCSCAGNSRIAEGHALDVSFSPEPMEKAFDEIAHKYPEIFWKETPDKIIRVRDSRKIPGLLNVRVKEFLVIEDRPPQAALPALWRTAEVAAYVHRHNIRLARPGAEYPAVKKTAPTIIQVKNGTVAEILDRIVAGYRSRESEQHYRLWAYRECRSGAETFVDIKVQ